MSDVESVRLELLSHEGHVRALGTLYRIFAFFGFLGTAFTAIFVVMAFVGATEPAQAGFALGALAFYAVATWLYYVVGQGLRNLDPKVRLAATVVGAISLIGFPIGTLLGLFLLWAVHGEKGKRVLSYDYRAVVAQTQHIEAKTPFWLAALLILFVALVVAMIIAIVAA